MPVETGQAPDGLAANVAALDALVRTLIRDNEELHVKIAALEQRDTPPPPEWVALKAAVPPGVNYETARGWCEAGFVRAEKQGGRWLVVREDLLAVATARLSGAA